MKKFVCTVCGYVHEGDQAPAECPICHAPASKFVEQTGDLVFADEHRIGVAKDVPSASPTRPVDVSRVTTEPSAVVSSPLPQFVYSVRVP